MDPGTHVNPRRPERRDYASPTLGIHGTVADMTKALEIPELRDVQGHILLGSIPGGGGGGGGGGGDE
jgi:hypothetical protein